MSTKKKILIGAAIVAVVAFFVVFNLIKSQERGLSVQAQEVKRGDLTAKVSASGRIQPAKKVDISANVSAKITAIAVKEGDRVEENQLLVQLDPTLYRARVEAAQASLNSTRAQAMLNKANLEQAQQEHKRRSELFEKKLTSQELLDMARTALKVQEAQFESANQQVAQAQAILEQAQDDLSKTTIRAPMAGIVTQLNSEVGEVVLGTSMSTGTVIMTISELSDMEVEVEVDESDVVDIQLAQAVDIEVDALPDTVLKGEVKEIANTAFTKYAGTSEQVTNFLVTIRVLDNVPQLKPGMSATVDITTATHASVLQVPIQSVVMREPKPPEEEEGKEKTESEAGEVVDSSSQGDSMVAEDDETRAEAGGEGGAVNDEEQEPIEVVFVVTDGVAEMRPVKTGIMGDLDIEIVEGLTDGDMVVTGSYQVLSKAIRDGQKVKIEEKKKGKGGMEAEKR